MVKSCIKTCQTTMDVRASTLSDPLKLTIILVIRNGNDLIVGHPNI